MLIITPKTKIFDLLEAYPQLEDVLIDVAPQFKKLKNPVLRKTITRITTLNQASVIAGLGVEELVNRLRNEVGQSFLESSGEEEHHYVTEKPDWYNSQSVMNTIDIREMLHAGEQPVHEVLSALKKLQSGEILEVIAPFIPAPLLDKAQSLGYSHWVDSTNGEEYRVYFME